MTLLGYRTNVVTNMPCNIHTVSPFNHRRKGTKNGLLGPLAIDGILAWPLHGWDLHNGQDPELCLARLKRERSCGAKRRTINLAVNEFFRLYSG